MTLAAGTKLGRYEIRAKIGEAGNGRGVFRLRPRIPAARSSEGGKIVQE